MSQDNIDGGPIFESDFSRTAFPPLLARDYRDTAGKPVVDVAPPEQAPPKYQIVIYLDDGVTFSYTVASMTSAREHVSAIIATGYRSVQEDCLNILVHYPPHRIQKIKIISPVMIETGYRDRASGT